MRISRFVIVALAAPIGLAAQQPSANTLPPNPVTAAFKARIAGLHRNIAQAFDSIPESKFSYKPTPAQLSIGYIAQHVEDANYSLCERMGELKPTRRLLPPPPD